jgi:hypothetical protein
MGLQTYNEEFAGYFKVKLKFEDMSKIYPEVLVSRASAVAFRIPAPSSDSSSIQCPATVHNIETY